MVDVTDHVCQLECVKENNVHEFVGPVRIILVDPPPSEYCMNQWGAVFIQLANMVIGATFLVVLFFTLSSKLTNLFNNLHVVLCTVGLVLCLPSGVLMCNGLNGASAPLKVTDRVQRHFLLNTIGFICAAGGGALVYVLGETSKKHTNHFYVGAVAIAFGFINIMTEPILFCLIRWRKNRISQKFHIMCGILSLTASASCFVLGINKPVFKEWVPYAGTVSALIVCCVFYTLVILYVPLNKLLGKKALPGTKE